MTVLPEERLLSLRRVLETRLREMAGWLADGRFDEYFDTSMRTVLTDAFTRAGADEGTVWLLDEPRQHLVPRYNSGPKAANFVGSFRQSLRAGMISMVVATEQAICENEMRRNAQQDKTLDQQLGLQTCAMIAVPFYYAGELRGVISCVQLQPASSEAFAPRGFSSDSMEALELTASVISRLIEHRLMTLCIGIEGLG
jgi:hypothetical protein